MDYKELIEQLKHCKSYKPKYELQRTMIEAATAIKTLLSERDKSLQELKDLKIMWDMYGGDEGIIEAFRKAAERDAAVEEIDHKCYNCQFYENNTNSEPCLSCTTYFDHWKWRGLEKGDER